MDKAKGQNEVIRPVYNPNDLFPARHKSGSQLKKDIKKSRKKKWWRG